MNKYEQGFNYSINKPDKNGSTRVQKQGPRSPLPNRELVSPGIVHLFYLCMLLGPPDIIQHCPGTVAIISSQATKCASFFLEVFLLRHMTCVDG